MLPEATSPTEEEHLVLLLFRNLSEPDRAAALTLLRALHDLSPQAPLVPHALHAARRLN